jgi:hypothetical protein
MTSKQRLEWERAAFEALATRLWCEDLPDDMHLVSSVEEWKSRLPVAEQWALSQFAG